MRKPPLIVSNRLPVRIVKDDAGRVDVAASPGGLTTALREVQRKHKARWLGWPGDIGTVDVDVVTRLLAAEDLAPIFLSPAEAEGYYEHLSNGVLWPLLHSNIDKLPLTAHAAFGTYRAVNERFASACLQHARDGEPIWVHDFHLALVPGELRRRVPHARIGFFLHVPFPPVEVLRVLPWARELLVGLLGADVVGFHTKTFADAFCDAVERLLGVAAVDGRIDLAGHVTRVGVFPISIDFARVDQVASSSDVVERVRALRAEARGRKILLGVDRLDYTKGIRRRLLAVEQLLERWPALAPSVHFIQIAVPTRENVDAYTEFRGVVNGLVGKINGKHGTATGVPIHFLHREIPFEELVALYAAADVMIVTPTRDGMNLVCKEYVAARVDERGVLVLSELAGAATELTGALIVNPFDIEAVALRLRQALDMPDDEQGARMTGMRRRVRQNDVYAWAESFLDVLNEAMTGRGPMLDAMADAVGARHLHLLLDYDGTLASTEATPAQAEPDGELRALLALLAAAPRTTVHVTSGRDRRTLDVWLGDLDLWLHAEHGAHIKPAGLRDWRATTAPTWLDDAADALRVVATQAPGAFVERKETSVALHLRSVADADRELAAKAAVRVLEKLRARDDGTLDLGILVGERSIEARRASMHKGLVRDLLEIMPGDRVLAAGDDVTDEDLFAALPADAITIAVGAMPSTARLRVRSPLELRTVLLRIASARA